MNETLFSNAVLAKLISIGEARAKLTEILDMDVFECNFLSKHNTYWDMEDPEKIKEEFRDFQWKLRAIRDCLEALQGILFTEDE